MKLAAITMIRDEADIIVPFLRHLDALFDIVIMLDQRSSDGTGEVMRAACAQRANWVYILCDFGGRHQKESVNMIMPRAFALGADVVFFIDSDEFVRVESKAELLRRASEIAGQPVVGTFVWRPCAPADFDACRFDLAAPLRVSEVTGGHSKIAIPRALYESTSGLCVTQGNHGLQGNDEFTPQSIECGEFFHIPLRSRRQTAFKTFIASIANFAKRNRMASEGWHKRKLLELIASGDMTDGILAWFARHYGEVTQQESRPWFSKFRDEGFELRALGVPASDMELPQPPQPDYDALLARCLAEFEIEDAVDGDGLLLLEGDVIHWQAGAKQSLADKAKAQAEMIQGLSEKAKTQADAIEQLSSDLGKRNEAIERLQSVHQDVKVQFAALEKKTRSCSWLIRTLLHQLKGKLLKF